MGDVHVSEVPLSTERPRFVSEPGVLRKCQVCEHFECPFCRIWCDTFVHEEDDESGMVEGSDSDAPDDGASEMCCDGECVYDRAPDPRLDAFFKSIPMYDEHGIGTGGHVMEQDDGLIVVEFDSPAEIAAAKARNEEEEARRTMKRELSTSMKAVLKTMGREAKGAYLVIDYGEGKTLSAIYKSPDQEGVETRIGKKAADDFAQAAHEEVKAAPEEVKADEGVETETPA